MIGLQVSFLQKITHCVEKANKVKEVHNLSNYDHIYVYDDSHGDKKFLALAHESFYKLFRKK